MFAQIFRIFNSLLVIINFHKIDFCAREILVEENTKMEKFVPSIKPMPPLASTHRLRLSKCSPRSVEAYLEGCYSPC